MILVFGDLHFKIDNVEESKIFRKRTQALLDAEKDIDMIVLLGDILHYHEKLHCAPMNEFTYFLQVLLSINVPIIILVGNHDMINHKQFLTTEHWMNILKSHENIMVVDTPYHQTYQKTYHQKLELYFCPYVPVGRFKEALDELKDDTIYSQNEDHLVFAHQEFYGCKMGAIESESGDKWDENWSSVISGHIHDSQWVGTNVFYTGSAMQSGYSNHISKIYLLHMDHEKQFNIQKEGIEIDKESKKITERIWCRRMIFRVPKKITKTETVQTLKHHFNEIMSMATSNEIKIQLKCTIEEFKAFKSSKQYKEIMSKNIKLSHKPELIAPIEKNFEEIPNFWKCLKDEVTISNDPRILDNFNELQQFAL